VTAADPRSEALVLLDAPSLEDRCRGVALLRDDPDPAAGVELASLLSESSWYLRERVVEALAARTEPVRDVLRVLDTGTWFARASACDAVGRRAEREALSGLLAAVEDRNVSLQKSAVRALERLADVHGVDCVARELAALPGERRRRVVARVEHQAPQWAQELDVALDRVPADRWSPDSGARRPPPPTTARRGLEARTLANFRQWLTALPGRSKDGP
jgi:hypothetical protein